MIKLEIPNPYSKSEILSSLKDIEQKVTNFFESMSPDLFYHNGLGGWSPAQNLSHLINIGTMSVILLKTPRFLFSIFGKRQRQRDFQTLLSDYIDSKAVIQIGPLAPTRILPNDDSKKIFSLLTKWEKVCRELQEVIVSIPEKDFDKYSIPHPSMGMLSYRELLYIIIIHSIHHCYKVEQKISNYLRQRSESS